MKAWLLRYGDVAFAVVVMGVMSAWPQIDVAIASAFYQPGIGFPGAQLWPVKLIYVGVARAWVVAPVLVMLLLAGCAPYVGASWRPRRRALLYLLTALLLGPGLIVNTVLKNQWGRPRPVHLAQFGGTAPFSAALSYSTHCPTNCSFPSGHAGAAFFLMAGYWRTGRRRWLVAGIACGLVVGVTRMVVGAHFLSDVIASGLIVHFCCRSLAYVFRFPTAGMQSRAPPRARPPAHAPLPAHGEAHAGADIKADAAPDGEPDGEPQTGHEAEQVRAQPVARHSGHAVVRNRATG